MIILKLNNEGCKQARAGLLNSTILNEDCRQVNDMLLVKEASVAENIDECFVADRITDLPEYALASRKLKPESTEIICGNDLIGGEDLTIIAGPCAIESYEQINRIAGSLAEMGIRFLRGGAYKPRTSPYSFQGLKGEGLEYLNRMKEKYGSKIVTELMTADHLDEVADVADIIQVGSRNMYNYSLLEALGKVNKPVLLKRGMSAKMNDFLLAAEYILTHGNPHVIFCERGISTFETATRNTLDLNVVPYIKQHSHLPIIVDPSHGTGIRSLVTPMSLAAIACGADGLEIEVHDQPDKALSDGPQSLTISQMKGLLLQLEAYKHIRKEQLV